MIICATTAWAIAFLLVIIHHLTQQRTLTFLILLFQVIGLIAFTYFVVDVPEVYLIFILVFLYIIFSFVAFVTVCCTDDSQVQSKVPV